MPDSAQPDGWTRLLVAVGVALILASLALPFLRGGRGQWGIEQAAQLQQAQASYHDAIHARAHPPRTSVAGRARAAAGPANTAEAQTADGEFEQSRRDYEELTARLQAARGGGGWAVTAARLAGALLLVGGAASWWARRPAS